MGVYALPGGVVGSGNRERGDGSPRGQVDGWDSYLFFTGRGQQAASKSTREGGDRTNALVGHDRG